MVLELMFFKNAIFTWHKSCEMDYLMFQLNFLKIRELCKNGKRRALRSERAAYCGDFPDSVPKK